MSKSALGTIVAISHLGVGLTEFCFVLERVGFAVGEVKVSFLTTITVGASILEISRLFS